MRKVNIVLFLTFFSLNITSWSANHYIRSGAPSGGDGASWASAWRELPDELQRGDTYYVADGDYPSYTFNTPASGSSWITIKKAIEQDHGTNSGWNSSYGDGVATWDALIFRTDYHRFDGQVGGGPGNWKSGHGFVVDPAESGKDCIHLDKDGTFEGAVNFITISHVEMAGPGRDVGSGMNCLEQTWGGSNQWSYNVTVQNCWLHDSSRSPIKTRHPRNWIFENSWVERNRSSAEKHAEGWSNHGGYDNKVRYNVFSDIEGTGIFVNLYATAYRWEFYGNVFQNTAGNPYDQGGLGNGSICTHTVDGPAVDWKIYNNTFYNLKATESSKSGIWLSSGGDGCEAFNNVYVECRGINHFKVPHEYNSYYDTHRYFTLTETEELLDENPFVDLAGGNFSLIDELPGTTLGTEHNLDLMGHVRGLDGAWDQGAVEFSGDAPGFQAVEVEDSDPNPENATPKLITSNRDVIVRLIGVQNNPTQIYISEDGTFDDVDPIAYSGTAYNFTLSDNDEMKTVYVKVANGAEEGVTQSYSIELDTTPPVLVSAVQISIRSMQVTFSEPLGESGLEPLNYSISGSRQGTLAVHPDEVDVNGNVYTLVWEEGELATEGNMTITVSSTETGGDKGGGNLPGGLVGYYNFDADTGTTALDSSGAQNHGTLGSNSNLTESTFGQAVRFSETWDDYVTFGLNGWRTDGGTVMLWTKVESFPEIKAIFFGHTTIPRYHNRLQLYTEGTDGWLSMGLGEKSKKHLNIHQLELNRWYHLTMCWDNDSYKVYVNGQLKATGSYPGLDALGANAHLGNSGVDYSGSSPMNGVVDEFRAYNRVLENSEIDLVYNSLSAGAVYDLAGHPIDTVNTVQFGNILPEFASAAIVPESAFADTVLSVGTAGWVDLEGAEESYTYQWIKNGIEIQGATNSTLESANLKKNDEIICRVTPWDGMDFGFPIDTDPVIIKNSPPSLSAVTLTPVGSVQPGTTLNAIFNGWQDVDEDIETYSIEWRVNGAIVPNENSETFDSTGLAVGDMISCVATPWDGTDEGAAVESSAVTLINPSSSAWYFSEGDSGDGFETFLLTVNPSVDQVAMLSLTILFEDREPVTVNQNIEPSQRFTFNLNQILANNAAADKTFAMVLRSINDVEVYAERAMYWQVDGIARGGGMDSTGVKLPSTNWLMAEGSTSNDRITRILIANPELDAATINVSFLLEGDSPVVREYQIGAQRRLTIDAADEVPGKNFSIKVESTNGVPVVVERTMYGAADGLDLKWGHNAMGATAASSSWYLAEGATHGTFETFLLLANPTDEEVTVDVRYLRASDTPFETTETIPANSRKTINVELSHPEMFDQAGFSMAVIARDGKEILVERAMYWRSAGFTQRSGATAVLGVPSPMPRWFLPEGAAWGGSNFENFILIGNPQNEDAIVRVTFIKPDGTTIPLDFTIGDGKRLTVKANNYFVSNEGTQSISTIVETLNGVDIVVERAMYWSTGGIQRIEGHASAGIAQ